MFIWKATWIAAIAAAALIPCYGGPEVLYRFQAGESGWHLGTIGLGNLNTTPELEILVPHRDSTGTWFIDAFTLEGERLPGFPHHAGGEAINVSPVLMDLNADGKDEIIITRGNSVVVLRPDATVLWSSAVSASNYVPTGGFQTVTNGFYWSGDGRFVSRLPSSAVLSSEVSPPMVVDLAGNGKLEVLTAWKIDPDPSSGLQDFNPFIFETYGVGHWGLMGETWSGGVMTFDALTGKPTYTYHMHHLVESGLAVGRATRSGPLHIYELNDSDSVVAFDKSKPFGLWGKGTLHKQFGKNQRLMTGSYQYPVDIYTADVDGDGLDEVLVAGTQRSSLWQPNETILDDDGTILWRRWLPHQDIVNNMGWFNSASLIPCNPDHDNRIDVLGWNHGYEISFRAWDGAELANRPGWPKNFYPLVPTPPVVGDVDGDGAEEIVIGTYNPAVSSSVGALNIFGLDGTLEFSVPVVGGIKHIPALVDTRRRGRLDVVYRTTLGEITVQNFGGSSSNAVSWATHRGNMRRDGNFSQSLYPEGTPMITRRESGASRVSFAWTNSAVAQGYRVYRASRPEGPYALIATLASDVDTYTDMGLAQGSEYYYELEAIYGTRAVRSAPFAILAFMNGNLLCNSGFEECENSHWDKWFTGTVGMTNMVGTTNEAFHGRRSMQVRFEQQSGSGSIAQFNQYGIPDSTLYVTPGAYYSFGGFIKSSGLTQPSEHWLQWGSAKTGVDTNNRPSLPWPDYFTPQVTLGTESCEWTYVNRTFKLPAGFPNLELFHNFSVAAPGNGSIYLDDIFFRQLPAPDSSKWVSLVPFGANWRYSTEPVSDAWTRTNYNDSGWALGKAKFGAGGGPQNVATRLPQFKPAYYFRTQFTNTSAPIEDLLLSATCTDDSGAALYPIQLYLNGSEVQTTMDVVTSQGNQVRLFDLTPFANLLRTGTNTIAVRVDNYWSSWDDVAFDVRLQAIESLVGTARLSITHPANGPALEVETPPGTGWRIESRDAFGPWQLMQQFTNYSATPFTVIDQGQCNRQPPSKVPARFYRLMPAS